MLNCNTLFSKIWNSTTMRCYTSFLASTNAQPSIAIKDSILISILALGHHQDQSFIAIEGRALIEA